MDFQEQTVPSGLQHYSGRNRVPNIREFMDQLDREKKDRDAAIDQELSQNNKHGEVKEHHNVAHKKKDTRSVRDPVTGKDVDIRDADLDFKEAVENPKVSIDHGNDTKLSGCETDLMQALHS